MTGGQGIFFEFITIAAQVRVSAIDEATGVEVVVVGPAGAARHDLEALARRKLLARLRNAAPAPKES